MITPKDLLQYGIKDVKEILYNPSYNTLFAEETKPELKGLEKGIITRTGAIAIDTGVFTGRSPKDKYVVLDDKTQGYCMVEIRNGKSLRQQTNITWRYGTIVKK